MRHLQVHELAAVSGGAKKPNYGGGPGIAAGAFFLRRGGAA
ncbi:MAG TPA: hypothetical protein VGC56_13660 [Allosphingosinicella sp.]|jgi:hypothetical protein